MGTHTLRARLLAAASLTALTGAVALTAGPATAAEGGLEPGQQRTLAEARALEISLFGQELSIGLTDVSSAAAPLVRTHALGAVLAGTLAGEELLELAGVDLTEGDDQPTCSPLVLPAELPVLDLAVACGTAKASTAGGTIVGDALAGMAEISLSATNLLNDTPLAQLPVQATVDQLLGGLAPVFEVVDQLGLDAESLVSELLNGITQGGDLVSIQLGPSGSLTNTDAATSLAKAAAQGATITVIDRSLLSLPPVLTIEVGAAASQVSADRATGEATPTVDPALVRVTIADDIAAALLLPTNVIEIAPGQTQCLGLPAPLDSCISVAGGRTLDTADGGKRAESEGVGIQLLNGLPDGGVVLNLAATAAEAAAGAPVETPRVIPAAPAQPTLARTGAESTLPIALALGAAGLAGLAITRRRTI